jgi:hypothetical protein
VLDTLDAALKDLRQLAARKQPPPGYPGFQQVQNRMEQSRGAVEGVAERKSLVNELKRLDDAVSKIGSGGKAAPLVKGFRAALATLLKELGSA